MAKDNDNICPKCGSIRLNENECFKCGIIFSKYNQHSFSNIAKPIKTQKAKKIRTIYIVSFFYLILVIFDMIIVYENEYTRPNRERLYSTIDLVNFTKSYQNQLRIKRRVEDLLDRRIRTSRILDYIENNCRGISPGIISKRTKNSIECILPDKSSLFFSSRNQRINIRKRKLLYESSFKFLPNILKIHMKYKNIDYDFEVQKTHSMFPDVDFSAIEKKYQNLANNTTLRILVLATIVWSIPNIIYYLFLYKPK